MVRRWTPDALRLIAGQGSVFWDPTSPGEPCLIYWTVTRFALNSNEMTSHSGSSWAFQIASTIDDDLIEIQTRIDAFRAGQSSVAEFRAFRVPMGIYEQRES